MSKVPLFSFLARPRSRSALNRTKLNPDAEQSQAPLPFGWSGLWFLGQTDLSAIATIGDPEAPLSPLKLARGPAKAAVICLTLPSGKVTHCQFEGTPPGKPALGTIRQCILRDHEMSTNRTCLKSNMWQIWSPCRTSSDCLPRLLPHQDCPKLC